MALIKVNKIFQEPTQNEALEIFFASQVASFMLYPLEVDQQRRIEYMALALNKVHNMWVESQREYANELFNHIVCYFFGNLATYSNILACTKRHKTQAWSFKLS